MDRQKWKEADWIPIANLILIGINVLVFAAGLLTDQTGWNAGFLYQNGALYAPLILRGMDLHRMVTSIFLHADPGHLMNNMVVQFAGGDVVERNLGHIRFALLYMISGVAGNAASVLADFAAGSYGFSVGASGAVFGIIGALLFLILREALDQMQQQRTQEKEEFYGFQRHRTAGREDPCRSPLNSKPENETREIRRRMFSPQMKSLLLRAAIMTGYLLYSGWNNPMINQAAHVGGLVAGFVAAVFMMPRERGNLEALLRG